MKKPASALDIQEMVDELNRQNVDFAIKFMKSTCRIQLTANMRKYYFPVEKNIKTVSYSKQNGLIISLNHVR